MSCSTLPGQTLALPAAGGFAATTGGIGARVPPLSLLASTPGDGSAVTLPLPRFSTSRAEVSPNDTRGFCTSCVMVATREATCENSSPIGNPGASSASSRALV